MGNKAKELPAKFEVGFMADMDQRTKVYQVLAGNLAAIRADLGGEDALTHVKAALVERFVFLEAVLQKLEHDIATNANGNTADLLGKWIQGVNSLQGLAQRIGLERRAREAVTDLDSYVKRNGRPPNKERLA